MGLKLPIAPNEIGGTNRRVFESESPMKINKLKGLTKNLKALDGF
jgi:hypothetical protein